MSLLKLINSRGSFVHRPLWLMYSPTWIQSAFIKGVRPLNHHYNSVVKGFGCSYVNYSYPILNNNTTGDSIEEQIKNVEVEIKRVQSDIAKVEKKIEESEGTEKEKYFMDKEKQLRDEKNKLLDKENKLLDEKNLLLQKQQPVEQSMNEFGSICSSYLLFSFVILV